jgi:hypothetical protein
MIERWFDIFGKNIKDEYMILKGVADVVPVASSVKFFVETGGRSEGLTTPPITYVKTLIENVRNVINVSFTDKEWEDAESRDLVNALSGVTPFPAGQVNNYLFGESTAFETGAASIPAIIGGVQTLPQRLKDMVEIVKELEGKAQASQLTQVEESTLVEVYRTLMEEPGGRSTLASYIEQNQIPIMSQDEVYNIIFTESNGVPNAVNNRSGAAGIGQFMTNTWNDLIGEHSNELRDIDPAGGESDGRVDPVQSMVMLERLHKDIAISLVRSGIEPSQTNIYIGHHFGTSQAIELIKADDSTKAKVAYGKASSRWVSVVDQNPWMRNNMTVGQFKEHIDYLLMAGAEKQLRWEEENGPFDPYNLP